jgi:hypothetical protein
MNESDTLRKVEMPLLGRAMGYAAGLKTCHDCFADRAAIVLYDAIIAARAEIDKWEQIACDKLSEVCRQIEKTRLVTEQRDRLAEALSLIEREEKPTSMKIFSSKAIATEALQSLTPKDHE